MELAFISSHNSDMIGGSSFVVLGQDTFVGILFHNNPDGGGRAEGGG